MVGAQLQRDRARQAVAPSTHLCSACAKGTRTGTRRLRKTRPSRGGRGRVAGRAGCSRAWGWLRPSPLGTGPSRALSLRQTPAGGQGYTPSPRDTGA